MTFTLKNVAHLKTKEDFKEVFGGLCDVDLVWKDVEKARPKKDVKKKKGEDQ